MDSSMIMFRVKLKGEQECVLEGEQKWNKFVNDLYDLYFDFNNKYIAMIYVFEDWAAALKPLRYIKKILTKEMDELKNQVYIQLKVLQDYTVKHGHDWRKWNQSEVKKVTRSINDIVFEAGAYFGDFMVLIHNELLSKYFSQKRSIRKTLGSEHKVLTKNGIVENVDKEKIQQMKIYKYKLIAIAQEKLNMGLPPKGNITPEYENFLRSIINGICPNCNNPIKVFNIEESDDTVCFNYICGHSWKIVNIKETMSIKESIKAKIKKEGFKKFARLIVQGWKPSGDQKLNSGVDVYLDVNKEKNEFHHIVKDSSSKKVLHEEHEALTEHKPKK